MGLGLRGRVPCDGLLRGFGWNSSPFREFGATFGDLLTRPVDSGGLNFGTVGSSIVLATILMVLVWYSTKTKGTTTACG